MKKHHVVRCFRGDSMEYNILIADDAMMNRALVKNVLFSKLEDVQFVEAENGVEVLKIVSEQDIHLIILDLIMPLKDGYETLIELKANPLYKDIPVIVNSSISEIESIEMTLMEGAMDYFTKPLSPEEMQIILPLKARNALMFYEQTKTINELNRKIDEELKNANHFANFMLPKSSQFDELDLHILYQPSMGIGGDFFDCVKHGENIWFMIADVTGHGIAAGMTSSMLKIMFRNKIEVEGTTPKEVLGQINSRIFELFEVGMGSSYFVFTAFVGCITNGVLTFSNAGQPYPILYEKDKQQLNSCDMNGFPLGMLDGLSYEDREVHIGSGDGLFLYTDGLFSSGTGGDFVNWTEVIRNAEYFKDVIDRHPATFLRKMKTAFRSTHTDDNGDLIDDVAMMLLKMK